MERTKRVILQIIIWSFLPVGNGVTGTLAVLDEKVDQNSK